MSLSFYYYQKFVTVDDKGKIIIGTYEDARNRKGWVSLGRLQRRQPEYELDEEGNIFRTLWGKKRILYTSDQIRQAVELAKRKKERVPHIRSLLAEFGAKK
jgi:hypothetical protein